MPPRCSGGAATASGQRRTKTEGIVEARVKYHARVGYTVECQRAKYKHWHLIGTHRETDIEFKRALGDGSVQWLRKVFEPEFMF